MEGNRRVWTSLLNHRNISISKIVKSRNHAMTFFFPLVGREKITIQDLFPQAIRGQMCRVPNISIFTMITVSLSRKSKLVTEAKAIEFLLFASFKQSV